MIKRWAFLSFTLALGLLLLGCGIAFYPGQPAMVTNGFSKLELEDLEFDGLYVYEVSYDNRGGKKNVGAIVTKRYAKAQTYTSNARTNADGTLYRNKSAYEGATVELISLPSLNQLIFSPNSSIAILIDYDVSLDEQDDRNLAEEKIFGPMNLAPLSRAARESKLSRWQILRAGQMGPLGTLAYDIVSADIAGKVFTPSQMVKVETNLLQSSIKSNITSEMRVEAAKFLETHFPKGYKGMVKLFLKGVASPMTIRVGLHTIKTAESSGQHVTRNASPERMQDILDQIAAKPFL